MLQLYRPDQHFKAKFPLYTSNHDEPKKPTYQYLINGSLIRLNFVELCHHHPSLVIRTATVPHWGGADLVTHSEDVPEKYSKKVTLSNHKLELRFESGVEQLINFLCHTKRLGAILDKRCSRYVCNFCFFFVFGVLNNDTHTHTHKYIYYSLIKASKNHFNMMTSATPSKSTSSILTSESSSLPKIDINLPIENKTTQDEENHPIFVAPPLIDTPIPPSTPDSFVGTPDIVAPSEPIPIRPEMKIEKVKKDEQMKKMKKSFGKTLTFSRKGSSKDMSNSIKDDPDKAWRPVAEVLSQEEIQNLCRKAHHEFRSVRFLESYLEQAIQKIDSVPTFDPKVCLFVCVCCMR